MVKPKYELLRLQIHKFDHEFFFRFPGVGPWGP